jgi:hypothetical protein
MIRLLKHHQIDLAKYDLCVAMDERALPYGYSWYLSAVCEWEALVKDDYDAVWPLPVNVKFGQRYYYRPFGIQQLGIFSKKTLSDEELIAFTQHFAASTAYADVYLNEGQLPAPLTKLRFAAFPNHVLDLNQSYEQLYSGFNTNTRRNIKKSQGQNFELFLNDSPKVLIKLFKQNRGQQLNLSEAFYQKMEKLMFLLLHKNKGQLYSIYGGPNQLLAAAFFVQAGKRHVFLFSGVDEMGKELGAMYYLLNEYLIYHSGKAQLLDFEGSKDPGTARFYSGFGTLVKQYQHLVYNNLPFYMRWLKNG